MKKTVLITGATGFVGSLLSRRLLEENYEVHILTRESSNKWRISDIIKELHKHFADIRDKENILKIIKTVKPNYVFHFAVYGGYPKENDFDAMVQTNIFGSLNLFQALENRDFFEGVVNIGSSSEYGQKSELAKETNLLEPDTPYAVTKASQTLLGRYFSKNRGLPLITLRLFSVYGSYEEPGRLIFDLMTGAVHKQKISLSSPLPRRDFIFADDVLDICVKAAKSLFKNGEVFNVGSGKDYSIGEIVSIFEEVLGRKLEIFWGAHEKKRNFDVNQKWFADISKIKTIFDWEPTHSLKEGLKKTYEWYCDNIDLYDEQNKN